MLLGEPIQPITEGGVDFLGGNIKKKKMFWLPCGRPTQKHFCYIYVAFNCIVFFLQSVLCHMLLSPVTSHVPHHDACTLHLDLDQICALS